MQLFGWLSSSTVSEELGDIYPFAFKEKDFVSTDCQEIYSKILIDVAERTQGLNDNQVPLLFDSALQSNTSQGLISLLARAMYMKSELFIVYKNNVIRLADPTEQKQIKDDYEKMAKSSTGIFVSFKHYNRSDMVKLYSMMDYYSISSLYKSMNLSKAVQIKVADLRGSTSMSDSASARKQAKEIADALKCGNDILLDAKDSIETAKPDVEATEKAISFIDGKRSFYLGLPASYITGEQTGGIGSTGEGDARAVERGLKNYYYSIFKPVVEALFGVKTSFKSQDFKMIDSALNALKVFDLTSDDYLLPENKQMIIEKLMELDAQKITRKPPVQVAPVVDPAIQATKIQAGVAQ